MNLLNQRNVFVVSVEAESGAMGGSLSHEYHYVADAGEDTLLKCPKCEFTSNAEFSDDACPKCSSPKLGKVKGIEVDSLRRMLILNHVSLKWHPIFYGCFRSAIHFNWTTNTRNHLMRSIYKKMENQRRFKWHVLGSVWRDSSRLLLNAFVKRMKFDGRIIWRRIRYVSFNRKMAARSNRMCNISLSLSTINWSRSQR